MTNPFRLATDSYGAVRPSYPREAVETIVEGAEASTLTIADVGAGTGKLTAALLSRGVKVTAIEPAPAMRDQMRQLLGEEANLKIVNAYGEATGLADSSVDRAVFAQSWHWMDAEAASAEMHRIVRPGGKLMIVWNQRDVTIPWVHRLTRIMRSGDVHRPDRPPTPGGGFAPMRLTQVAWEDVMTPEQVLTLGTTRSSYIRSSGEGRARMQANLRWYLYEYLGYAPGEEVAIPYTTLVWRAEREDA